MSSPRKRVIGLALGSGAARGWSHVGVLKALNVMGIYPDVVVGCSAGAFVGAAYANGRLEECEAWGRSLRHWDVMKHFVANYSTGEEGGLLAGAKLFDEVMLKIIGDEEITKLPVKYAAVATDIATGKEVWLQEGSLLRAVRASMAIPVVVAPIRHEGMYLIDGGLVNPVPVTLARSLGAEVVIAVNLNSAMLSSPCPPESKPKNPTHPALNLLRYREPSNTPIEVHPEDGSWKEKLLESVNQGQKYIEEILKKEKMIPNVILQKTLKDATKSKTPASEMKSPKYNMFDVARLSVDIMQDRITRARLIGDPPDINISPKTHGINSAEFHRAEEAIIHGWEATFQSRALLEAGLPDLIRPDSSAQHKYPAQFSTGTFAMPWGSAMGPYA